MTINSYKTALEPYARLAELFYLSGVQGEMNMRRIYVNGNIYTFEKSMPKAEAVVTEGDRFIDIGTTEEILDIWEHEADEIIDLEKKTVTPGLIDSHIHLAGVAGNFIDLDVTGLTSKGEMLEAIKQRTAILDEGEWLIGRGWDEHLFTDGGIPTIEELNQACPAHPLFISRICSHAALVNQYALDVCDVHAETPVPEGGTIVVDEVTKEPTGLLLESATELMMQHIPDKSYDTLKNAMRQTIKYATEKGLTSVHTNDPQFLGGLAQTYQIYDELLNGENLGLRCNLLIDYIYLTELRESGMYRGYGNDTLQIGAVKIFADGAFGRRTALLAEPYSDDPETNGEAMFDQQTFSHIVKESRKLSMPVAIHTIGDLALQNALDILDQYPPVSYRDRLIHVQVLREDLLKRLKKESRVVDIQPRFLASDFPWVKDRLGEERMKDAYAWKSIIDAGILAAGGSDGPVEPLDPLLGIHAAVTRKIPGEMHNGYYPEQKLSMKEAFLLFTKMGAYATNEETIKGTIARGKLADMTVYSHNPFTMKDPDLLLKTTIERTIIGGKVIYEK